MSTKRLTPFAHQKYFNLETYRNTGRPVATPVWFAEDHGTFYIYSLAHAGKVKRIRHNAVEICRQYLRHDRPPALWGRRLLTYVDRVTMISIDRTIRRPSGRSHHQR
jgi:hypothetical protein